MGKLIDSLGLDVAIVGGGPSGLVAGYYLSKAGKKVAMFEKKISIGGGIWGGGMMFNEVVVQMEGKRVLDELGIESSLFKENYYTVDSVFLASRLINKSIQSGLRIFNLVSVEDVVIKRDKVSGLVINWGPVSALNLHVDPLSIHSEFVLDATGHDANITKVLVQKMGICLNTPTGGLIGERSMEAEKGEFQTVDNTREAYPGLYVCGMAANAVYGGHRMGPIFGGMLLSGKKAAQEMIGRLCLSIKRPLKWPRAGGISPI